eukprot:Hpha_TRINITY_DN16480_c3_g3::TRINITY_DN16480_c3_g3_i1::g.163729::m.163729
MDDPSPSASMTRPTSSRGSATSKGVPSPRASPVPSGKRSAADVVAAGLGKDPLLLILSKKEVLLGSRIGVGGQGEVYAAQHRATGTPIVEKRIRRGAYGTVALPFGQTSEARMLRELRHQNIVAYFGFCEEGDSMRIWMEYVSGAPLSSVIQTFRVMHPRNVQHAVTQVLLGMAYIHGKGIVHQDIKPANILVRLRGGDSPLEIKLADFGMANKLNVVAVDAHRYYYGTWNYWSVEYVTSKGLDIGFHNDVWAMGLTVREMLTGDLPWKELEGMVALIVQYNMNPCAPAPPPCLPPVLVNFLDSCLYLPHTKRPSAEDLLQHAFITAHGDSLRLPDEEDDDTTSRAPSDCATVSFSFDDVMTPPESPISHPGPTNRRYSPPVAPAPAPPPPPLHSHAAVGVPSVVPRNVPARDVPVLLRLRTLRIVALSILALGAATVFVRDPVVIRRGTVRGQGLPFTPVAVFQWKVEEHKAEKAAVLAPHVNHHHALSAYLKPRPLTESFAGWNCVNGNTSALNMCHTPRAVRSPYLRVDLGTAAVVGFVRILNRRDCCQDRLGAHEVWAGINKSGPDAEGNWLCANVTAAPAAVRVEHPCLHAAAAQHVYVLLPGSRRTLALHQVMIFPAPPSDAVARRSLAAAFPQHGRGPSKTFLRSSAKKRHPVPVPEPPSRMDQHEQAEPQHVEALSEEHHEESEHENHELRLRPIAAAFLFLGASALALYFIVQTPGDLRVPGVGRKRRMKIRRALDEMRLIVDFVRRSSEAVRTRRRGTTSHPSPLAPTLTSS